MDKDLTIHTFCSFLNSIGISTVEKKIEGKSFLPGLNIENGTLVIDREKLLYPGDILHEAGHIALSTATERSTLNANVADNNPEKEGEEMGVMLWTYAASLHLETDPAIVFHKDGYKGGSDWILEKYEEQNYIGLPLLVWMGMTTADKNGFPKMLKWLRD